jgi:hypothetical protein
METETQSQPESFKSFAEKMNQKYGGKPAEPTVDVVKPRTIDEITQSAIERNNRENPGFLGTAADVGKSLAAGTARGAGMLADLPSDLTQLVSSGSKYLTGYETPKFDTNFREGVSDLTGGFSERKADTTLGRYAGTIGEFIPGAVGAALTGGGSLVPTLLRGAVAPAIGSEFAGQMLEGSSSPYAEPAARLAGAMLGGFSANKIENLARGVISPTGGANAAGLAEAARLRELGVPVSAGRATGNAKILAAEADTPTGQSIFGAAPDSGQAKAFTGATMRHIGSDAELATPEALLAAKNNIVGKLDSSVDGVVVQPTLKMLDDVAEARKYYTDMTPATEKTQMFSNIIRQMSTGQPIDAKQLAAWRSNLGDALSSSNEGIRGSAFRLRSTIDDAIENQLKIDKTPEKFSQWKEAKTQYRNYLAIRDAVKLTKMTGVNGVITPKDLMAALARQSKDEIVTGRRGGLGELATLGVKNVTPLPPQGREGFLGSTARAAGPLAAAAGAGFGALQGAQFMGLSPLLTALGTGAAVAAPLVGAAKSALRGTVMNPTVQKYLENQLVNSNSGISNLSAAKAAAMYGYPSATQGRQERKSGGRVDSHEAEADRLVMAAERAKKGLSAHTEGLLNTSDDAVASALEIANRSI